MIDGIERKGMPESLSQAAEGLFLVPLRLPMPSCTNNQQPLPPSLMSNISMSFRVSIRSLTRPINAQVTIAREAEVLEQEAALEVFVRVQNGVELARIP